MTLPSCPSTSRAGTAGGALVVALFACATARADMVPNPLLLPFELVAALVVDEVVVGAWAATIAIEAAVLAVLLSARHGRWVRLFAGIWLSACTLPVVWFVLPELLPRGTPAAIRLVAAETFAPLAECGLFWWACIRPLPADSRATVRDCVAIVVANLASFAAGEAAWRWLSLV